MIITLSPLPQFHPFLSPSPLPLSRLNCFFLALPLCSLCVTPSFSFILPQRQTSHLLILNSSPTLSASPSDSLSFSPPSPLLLLTIFFLNHNPPLHPLLLSHPILWSPFRLPSFSRIYTSSQWYTEYQCIPGFIWRSTIKIGLCGDVWCILLQMSLLILIWLMLLSSFGMACRQKLDRAAMVFFVARLISFNIAKLYSS